MGIEGSAARLMRRRTEGGWRNCLWSMEGCSTAAADRGAGSPVLFPATITGHKRRGNGGRLETTRLHSPATTTSRESINPSYVQRKQRISGSRTDMEMFTW